MVINKIRNVSIAAAGKNNNNTMVLWFAAYFWVILLYSVVFLKVYLIIEAYKNPVWSAVSFYGRSEREDVFKYSTATVTPVPLSSPSLVSPYSSLPSSSSSPSSPPREYP